MGSQWFRLWRSCFILWLCAGCSDANVARHSGEYRLDIDATEGRSPGLRELFDNVVLTLNSDGSFSLAGKFAGVSRTDRGMWSIAGEKITLRFTHVGEREERFAKVATRASPRPSTLSLAASARTGAGCCNTRTKGRRISSLNASAHRAAGILCARYAC